MARHKNLTKLKIKIKHLALEPVIIRKEERKLLKEAKWHRQQQEEKEASFLLWDYIDLMNHRKFDVRTEARATQLAYAFLRGRTYLQTESNCNRDEHYSEWMFTHGYLKRAVEIATKYRIGKYAGMTSNGAQKEIQKDFREWFNTR